MPHAPVQLVDGVNTNRTPAANQYGLSASQLIRYMFDNTGAPMCQKLGGWSLFASVSIPAVIRALAAWEDTNDVAHLAYGTQNVGSTGQAQLAVITSGSQQNITPTSTTDNVTPAASTTSGSPVVEITDATTTGITSFDAVYILTHISVGGIVLFGLYQATQVSNTIYDVVSVDVLGNPLPATSTSTTTTVASFATTNGSNVISVTLANHGYAVGSTYPVLVSTTVGGVTLYGNYIVQSVTSSSVFTINAATNATSSTSGSINGGNARYLYSFGIGANSPGTGYGIGGYGRGGYGTGTNVTPGIGTPIGATDWTLDNFGEVLLACPINGTLFQPIYAWDPLSGSPTASVIANAPPLNDGFFVAMPERQIVAWGSTETGIQDPLLVRWCDVASFNNWIGTPIDQAGAFRLTRGSKIVGGIQGPQQGLLWTDLDLWSMQYINLPDIYGFNIIGTGCGLISRKAAASANGAVYWMGPSQFFSLTSNGVQPLPCPVWDEAFQDLDTSNLSKIRVAVNSRFNEVAWYLPTLSSGGEVAAYVKYNYVTGFWDVGALARSAWVDQSVLGPPIGADPNVLSLFQHEVSEDANGQPLVSSFTTGYFTLADVTGSTYQSSDADVKVFVDQFWPDAIFGQLGSPANATLSITFNVVDYPGDAPVSYGPYTFTQSTQYFTPRFRGRLVSMTIGSADVGSFWRMGRMRYRFAPAGKY
jgi:hypothetical protein